MLRLFPLRAATCLFPLLAGLAPLPALAAAPDARAEAARWAREAAAVTITRDDWGIAHVHGASDADAVFGAIYAQAEDDFPRIEMNYLTALGRVAEAEGEAAIWQDLRQRLYVDPEELKAQYVASPSWLRALMQAWADGLNYYLACHPEVRPKVLTRFEPWMALSFTEGSIGGDIERSIPLTRLQGFYEHRQIAPTARETGAVKREPSGSNGVAIAPANTRDGHALLLINPHTSFYFRSELQMTSDEGLDAYGASTWGQFFIYQGFNARSGWMHTSSGVDNIDAFAETVVRKDGKLFTRYGNELRPVTQTRVTLAYRTATGEIARRTFPVYRTTHGPVVAEEADGRWIAQALMWKPVPALEQSWLRTKTEDLAGFLEVAERKANSSNDTIYADAKGEIAYLHPQFVPLRDDAFDYTRTVDGADPATDWKGLHTLDTLPAAIYPKVGWVHNTNDWPWDAAGPDSPKAADFPKYMDQFGPNYRGVHADEVLAARRDFTPEALIAAAFDSHLPAFAMLLPHLLADYDALPASDPLRAQLAEPIALLRGWDCRWGYASQATTLAVFWGDTLGEDHRAAAKAARKQLPDYIAQDLDAATRLAALHASVARLKRDFGTWRVAWGDVNRFQRLDDAITPHFDDAKPSLPVPFVSSVWGSLASFGAKTYPDTKKYYGTSGNSFVAVVEFGPRLRAFAVTAGGESGNPASPHFDDQIELYAQGKLRKVYFYPEDLTGHVETRYHPGA
ncbi:penicillin acylase family protein [Novosphingobium profundi]|uniref:penicillin acylase family protein n=1 Tax=Novosphingobium profundi TaxID=1774954 RepID=UPI001BD9A8A1|nr:penicillin acylase family protein [Novosphingobium profundi]MBT0668176.1 penicillin acylase family protein [Novosphingobium profundi]